MSDGKKAEDDKITFVVTTNPYDATSAANKKRVRSVAALKSWPERRRKIFENWDQSGQGGFVLDPPEPRASSSKSPLVKKSRPLVPPRTPSAASVPGGEQYPPDEEPLFEKCTRASANGCQCVHCRLEKSSGRYYYGPPKGSWTPMAPPSVSRKRTADGKIKTEETRGEVALLTPPSSPMPSPLVRVNNVGRAEPFNQYPVHYLPIFDFILNHMMTVFAPRGWPLLKITNQEGLSWENFMTLHALKEPALFYVRLLFASGDLIRLKVLQPEVSWWLQSQAVLSINEALQDPERATSDAIILAIGRIAMHESFYGDKHAANTMHRPAQRRIIGMRGGMKNLPFPELVKRLMRWADTVMSKSSGTERMLEDDEKNENYSMKQNVDVLEKWVPSEGEELRRKIKISDLLSPEPS